MNKHKILWTWGTFSIICALFLGGCTAVEPEKRAYPLIMAVDYKKQQYDVVYGMPDLSVFTGQDKGEGSEDNLSVLSIKGKNQREIEEKYNCTQEKYLDMGHLQVLILGESLIQEGKWREVLENIRKDPTWGEDIYLFAAEDVKDIMDLNGKLSSSLGEYLTGIFENRPTGKMKKRVSLRMAYEDMLEKDKLPALPGLKRQDEGIQVLFLPE